MLTYAMFPQVAPKFFAARKEGPKNLGRDPQKGTVPPASGARPTHGSATYVITLEGRSHQVRVTPAA